MTTIHATVDYNVRATINQHIKTRLAALTGLPVTLSYALIFVERDWAEPSGPTFTVVHRKVSDVRLWQGDGAGGETGVQSAGLLDFSAWVKRTTPNWQMILTTMESMMSQVFIRTNELVINNYLTTPASPSATLYLVRLRQLEFYTPPADPNPDVKRSSAVLRYDWIQRV